MNIIIQCAADKYNHGACFLRNSDGRQVLFVADPREYRCMEFLACRPDDTVPGETATWRERVLYLNQREEPGGSMLSCAAELYKHPVYRELTVVAVRSEPVSGAGAAISLLNREKTGNFFKNSLIGPQICR